MIRNADHVTIAVTDRDATVELLSLLGFRQEHVTTIDGGVPAAYMGMPDMTAEHITLALEGADPRFEIQLLVFEPTPGPDDDPGPHPTHHRRLGFNHLALRVDDLDETAAHLQTNGVRMLNEPMTFISRRLAFFEGPEGITVELVEWVDPPTHQP